jgi:hypothetical protein
MFRTVWVALICLISLGALIATKVGIASLASADVSDVVTIAGSRPDQPLAKSDKLKVLNNEPMSVQTTLPPMAIPPAIDAATVPEPPIKIVSRHWHDPLAPKTQPATVRSKAKSTGNTHQ